MNLGPTVIYLKIGLCNRYFNFAYLAAAAAVAQSVKRPELRSLKDVQLN